jgi:hypothetical protein
MLPTPRCARVALLMLVHSGDWQLAKKHHTKQCVAPVARPGDLHTLPVVHARMRTTGLFQACGSRTR